MPQSLLFKNLKFKSTTAVRARGHGTTPSWLAHVTNVGGWHDREDKAASSWHSVADARATSPPKERGKGGHVGEGAGWEVLLVTSSIRTHFFPTLAHKPTEWVSTSLPKAKSPPRTNPRLGQGFGRGWGEGGNIWDYTSLILPEHVQQ